MKKWPVLNGLLTRRVSILDTLFLVAVLLGPAAGYSKLYLFHLVSLALVLRSVVLVAERGRPELPTSLNRDVAFFLFFLGWYGTSILWAENKLYALQYCIYVTVGVLTVYYTAVICRTAERLRAALWVIGGAVSLEILLALMEGMRLIRLPFSPYSPHRWIFGREPSSFDRLSESQIEQVLSVPTGFAGNPNNLAAFLVLVLPMFLYARHWWVAALGAAAVYCVIDMAGARAAILGFWVVMAFAIVLFAGHRLRTGGIAVLLVATTMGGDLLTASAPQSAVPAQQAPTTHASISERAKAKVEAYSGAVTRLSDGVLSGAATGGDSVGIRTQLILNGLDALRETYGFGVGAGGSLTVQQNAASARIGEITSMHNFWVELLVDGGVLFAAVFFAWSGWLVWRLWQIGRRSGETILRYLGQALSVGFLGFFVSAIGPSSVIYMLPMWMIIGLALAVVRLNDQARITPVSPNTVQPAPAVTR